MGKSTPSAPEAPDPVATANAQAAANREGAISSQEMSMVNQITPYGNLTYDQTGTSANNNPQYTATQTLTPEQQGLLDTQNQVAQQFGDTAQTQLGNVSAKLAQPVDYSSLGAAPAANEATRTATRDSMLARLQPQMDQQRAALDTRLANQGFMTGTEGYNNAIDESNRAQNDAYLAADSQAGNEMARMYGLESSARNSAINEIMQQRNQPLNELSAMMGGAQVQGPQFVNAPGAQVAAADIMGATYGSANIANQQWQAGMQNKQKQTEGFYALLGEGAKAGAMAFSDRRLKQNISQIGVIHNGLPVYKFQYVWGGPEVIGLMADEVKVLHPHAVQSFGGYDAVNYAEAVK